MSDSERFSDVEELMDFIVRDDSERSVSANVSDIDQEDEEPQIDRLATLTSTLRSADTPKSRILKAHIAILASALGGPDHSSEEGYYKLGHDALACLKDLKRWIKSVDERNNTSDVALACADCGLFQNDLTVILCQWDKPPTGVVRTRTTDKIMIACLELMVLLTWPTEVNRRGSAEEYSSKARTRLAQLRYKHHVITYKGGKTLKAVIRLGINTLGIPREDQEPRDLCILRLIVYFIRNILYIEPLPESNGKKAFSNSLRYPSGIDLEDLSIASIIRVFENNNVLVFLTSIAHSVLSNLRDEQFGLLTVECLNLLTREIQNETFFVNANTATAHDDITSVVPPASAAAGLDLSALLSEEDRRKKRLMNAMSSRHGRFGTLLSLQSSSNASYLSVSGQKALASTYDTLEKLDRSKKWHKSSAFKYDSNTFVKRANVSLHGKTAEFFLTFVNQLLSSDSFNNLLLFVSRHLTNLANDEIGRTGILNAIDSNDIGSYFSTVSWFFQFKRNKSANLKEISLSREEDGSGYGSVAAALSEVNFILLVSYLRSSFESRDYNSLHVAMVCFREMLLIANSIFSKKRSQKEIELGSEDDINEEREMAEGIFRKLFSQKDFIDMCVNIPKTAHKHSPEFLEVVVSVVHILLRSLEALAKEDVKLFIRTRRKMRKLRTGSSLNLQMDRKYWHLIDMGVDEECDEEEIKIITRERKMDYKNTEIRFFHAEIVTAHIKFLSRYEDLSHDEVKRGVSYFHRLFVVHKDYSALFRLDFMTLLFKLQAFLPKGSSIRSHVDDFVIYFMKKFQASLENFPAAIEVLFPRLENLEYKGFLSTGELEFYDSRVSSKLYGSPSNRYFDSEAVQPRSAIIVQFVNPEKDLDEKIGAITYHLMKKKNTTRLLNFLSEEFVRVASMVKSDNKSALSLRLSLTNRRLLISESLVRLLLLTVGFDLPFLQNDETTLRSDSLKEILIEASISIKKWIKRHPMGTGDIEPFLDQFHSVTYSRKQLEFGRDALSKQRSGQIIDMNIAAELDINDIKLKNLIGFARRRECDEKIASKFYPDDKDYSLPDDIDNEIEDSDSSNADTKRRNRKKADLNNSLEFSGYDQPEKNKSKNKRKPSDRLVSEEVVQRSAISSGLVADSDDDSDSEEIRQFYEREEKLRNLIALRGGIASKDDLKAFQESWSSLITPVSSNNFRTVVTSTSRLFVTVLDDEEEEIDTAQAGSSARAFDVPLREIETNSAKRRALMEPFVACRKRAIIDDEDEE